MDSRSITISDKDVKKRIAEEVARQQSSLIGCFSKPKVPGIVINQWLVASVSDPAFLRFVGEEMAKIIKKIGNIDIICGVETAGIGIAAAASMASGIPWIYARKEKKPYGSRLAFEGTYFRGAKVVFIDNFTAKGKGMPEIFKNAEEEGFDFHHQISIIDNAWPKVPDYDKYDVNVHSLVTSSEIIDDLNSLKYYPGKLYEYMKVYVDNPAEWTHDSQIVKDFISEVKNAPDLPYIIKDSCDTL